MAGRDIPKAYDPGSIEPGWARAWVEERLFTPEVAAERRAPDKGTYSLAIPPPNVTGSLHMGHMLEHTQIDILMRWRRMQGYRVLWLPGTDHAGIATQVVVSRQLAEQGLRREDLGREEFERRVWEWKAASGDTIKQQMVRLGASCDWSRERFTLDPALYRAVMEAFLRLYREGLIYRGRYMVNWCPRDRTALSDLEVEHSERDSKLYFIRYPVRDTRYALIVATTRPETLLGDTGVAVHPEDDRYRKFVGKKAVLPLLKREIPILADAYVDREFGTGVVKVTPAHDPNDFEVGQRHGLPEVDIFDEAAHLNANAGPYAGLERFEARKRVLADLEAQGLLERVEPYRHAVGLCQRCKTLVEPRLSVQWFCRMNDPANSLARPAIEAVREGKIEILPENYKKIYLDWMENLRDWCLSRQLWWGHRIPIWHCSCGAMTPAQDSAIKVANGRPEIAHPPEKCSQCDGTKLTQDTDVLDTWFSSALWPFSTLGWPDDTQDLRAFYPTTLMINGFDILFFWDARMIMMGLKFLPQEKTEERIPFRTLYIHALVRDAERQKMSKTRGNVLDPLAVTEQYGTDATRFTLALMAAPGTDIVLSEDRLRSYRAFANKIWNAARFLFVTADKASGSFARSPWQLAEGRATALVWVPVDKVPLVHRWMFSRLSWLAAEINQALEEFRFHEAAHDLYHFFWHEFCDWYLEWLKPRLTDEHNVDAEQDWRNLWCAFDVALRLLHPFLPFITEELWHKLPHTSSHKSIALELFPKDLPFRDLEGESEMALVQEAIVALRNLRAELKVDAKRRVEGELASTEPAVLSLFRAHEQTILRLANLSALKFVAGPLPALPESGEGGVLRHAARFDARLPLTAADLKAEVIRLRKEKQKLEKELGGMRARLADREFRHKAPEEIVRGLEQRQAEYNTQYQKVTTLLSQLENRLSSGEKQREAQP